MDLDHIGFIVADLDEARRCFAGLGFTLTKRADHTRRDARGQVVPAGSSQHSVMFATGYIELMQITDPAAGHQLTAAMRERFGLHVLALGTDDALACHALRLGAGLPVGDVMDWSRDVRTPERSGTAGFRYFDLAWKPGDPSYLCWVQHLSPELIRTPSLLKHSNAACSLRGLHYRGPAQALNGWAQRLVAAGAKPVCEGRRFLTLGSGWIELQEDEQRPVVTPVGITLGFFQPGVLAAAARQLGLTVRESAPDVIEIDLSDICGSVIRAIPEPGG